MKATKNTSGKIPTDSTAGADALEADAIQEEAERGLDEALDESFPASDPISSLRAD
jgi:hypothetical protein